MENKKIIIQQGQSLLDIALQHCGDLSALFDLVVLNEIKEISITDEVAPGSYLLAPPEVFKLLVNYYADHKHIPATADSPFLTVLEGIDFWGIQVDFAVQ